MSFPVSFRIFSSAASSLLFLVGGCDTSAPLNTCTVSRDCRGEQVCVDGRCVAVTPTGDTGAEDTSTSDAGVDAGPPPPDRDGDGIPDDDEAMHGTDPDDADSDDDGLSDGEEVALGTDPTVWDSDGDGVPDGDEVFLGTDPTMMDSACADTSAEATLVRVPVDIIITIDSSGSMDGEIDAVQRNINTNLASILEAGGVDYRVILIGDYPAICIEAPLSGIASCVRGRPTVPTSGARFFHYDRVIASTNSFQRILETYDTADVHGIAPTGWGGLLRPGAARAFLEISDDDSAVRFGDFDADLLALSAEHFGTAAARNYTWHSIIGMVANDPATMAWPPHLTSPADQLHARLGGLRRGLPGAQHPHRRPPLPPLQQRLVRRHLPAARGRRDPRRGPRLHLRARPASGRRVAGLRSGGGGVRAGQRRTALASSRRRRHGVRRRRRLLRRPQPPHRALPRHLLGVVGGRRRLAGGARGLRAALRRRSAGSLRRVRRRQPHGRRRLQRDLHARAHVRTAPLS
jgi:hypothetical protein